MTGATPASPRPTVASSAWRITARTTPPSRPMTEATRPTTAASTTTDAMTWPRDGAEGPQQGQLARRWPMMMPKML